MIPKECKRLAEVDFPIAVVSKHAAREKSIRHGHPSTLHLWWARRPLAACRAMLLGLLLPDPCDENCPVDFKERARALLARVQGRAGRADEDLRAALLRFIGDFANWDLSANETYLEVSRGLVRAAHGGETPLVVDPFAGGGSIPLEALRLGCDAFASDLNPVACLIEKTLLEDIPRHGPELAEELRRVGKRIKQAAEKELAEFYPDDPDGAKPIAYLWARTVRCETPNCGAEIPLVRSFWLSKKASRRRALRHGCVRPKGETPRVEFEIFEPRSEAEVQKGTVSRAKATCPCCNITLSPDRVRALLYEQRGGANVVFDTRGRRAGGARLLAVVVKAGGQGRRYRLPTEADYKAIWKAERRLSHLVSEFRPGSLSPLPDEPLPPVGALGFRVQRYGVVEWGDFFTSRQKLALLSISRYIADQKVFARSIALALGKLADLANVVCPWEPIAECPRNVLSNGRIKPSWDFAEGVPISDSSGSFSVCVENLVSGILSVEGVTKVATTEVAAAQSSPLPSDSAQIWFTDPPYYNAIPYSNLSDMFFVWYKRALPNDNLLRDPFEPQNQLTPKAKEIIQDEVEEVGGEVKDKDFFEREMAQSFLEGQRVLQDNGVGCVVFAHKTTEGWEALLSGMIRGGWVISGSWPIATEMASRLRARDSAALATSVHLVCRPRSEDEVGDWGKVLRELPRRVRDWMDRLQAEGVRGADLVFACIGPALEIYSRYAKVVDPDEREIPLGGDPEAKEAHRRGYLAYVWEVVGRTALEQVLGTAESTARNGAAGALEEDARLTALFLWTLQSTNPEAPDDGAEEPEDEAPEEEDDEDESAQGKKKKGFTLVFDVVRRFAQPLGIHLDDWEGRVVETRKGVVRLLPVAERARQLFGEEGADAVASRVEATADLKPTTWLPGFEPSASPAIKGRGRKRRATQLQASDEALQARREATTLDRVHAAMLMQASGRANALRALLKAEQERGTDFVRLANALSALYPKGSEEKRLVDAMLLAVPR
ncbi:MAG TPA: DUF1156 domain-containing protein [Pyrinomonadaceae bacterium]|nr:DUF1156 domain-containing protein [Pyrinomonadaceae bacterium]